MENSLVKKEGFTEDQKNLIKQTICKGATDDEFKLFLHICERCGLDPFAKQIYAVKRAGQMTVQVSIDGSRLIADRTRRYAPGKQPIYEKDTGGRLISATAFVKKQTPDGTWHEVAATAYLDEYKPSNGNFWNKMPHVMLAKVAEALALRKAFPAELSGMYTEEEMEQANVTPITLEAESAIAEDYEKKIQELMEELKACPEVEKQMLSARQITSVRQIPVDKLDVALEFVRNVKKKREKK